MASQGESRLGLRFRSIGLRLFDETEDLALIAIV